MEKEFIAEGMHCTSCENMIERTVKKLNGIRSVAADYPRESIMVDYDPKKIDIDTIMDAVEEKGYVCFTEEPIIKSNPTYKKYFGIFFGIIGLLIIGYFAFRLVLLMHQ